MTQSNSQVDENNVGLPNLSNVIGKTKNKYRSPYKQPIKNRRNISVKQSWDKTNYSNKNGQTIEKTMFNTKASTLVQTLCQVFDKYSKNLAFIFYHIFKYTK